MLSVAPLAIFDPSLSRDAISFPYSLDPTTFFNDPHDFYSSGDDSSFFDDPSARARAHQQMQSNPSLLPLRSSTSQRSSMHVLDPMNPGALGEAPPHTKRRPKYTRSKAGCLTCRTKKIKVSQVLALFVSHTSLILPLSVMRSSPFAPAATMPSENAPGLPKLIAKRDRAAYDPPLHLSRMRQPSPGPLPAVVGLILNELILD